MLRSASDGEPSDAAPPASPVSEFAIVPSAAVRVAIGVAMFVVYAAARRLGLVGLGAILPSVAIGWSLIALSFSQTVTLYADGLEIRRGAHRERILFARTRAIARMPDWQSVALVLDSGRVFALRARPSQITHLRTELRARYDAFRASVCPVVPELAPPRAGVGAWMAALRDETGGPGEGRAPYRQAVLSPDSLWKIVESPATPARIRVGAAVALSSRLDEEARSRLCSTASACSEPALRVSLRAVAAGQDARAAEAIARLR
jgi:hypothetical protein